MYRLVYLTGPRQGRRITVQEGDVLFGTAAECPVRLVHPAVAPQHALLQFRPDGIYLVQLATGYSVSINGKPITQQKLVHGDEIGVANERFLFQLADPPTSKPRRTGSTHRLTQLAVGGILIAQALVIAGLLLYRYRDPIVVAEDDLERAQRMLSDRLQEHARTAPPLSETFQLLPPFIVVPQYTRPDADLPPSKLDK